MNNPTYIVYNAYGQGDTGLGYIYQEQPNTIQILFEPGRSILDTTRPLTEHRPATLADFQRYRVQPPPNMHTQTLAAHHSTKTRANRSAGQLKRHGWTIDSITPTTPGRNGPITTLPGFILRAHKPGRQIGHN